MRIRLSTRPPAAMFGREVNECSADGIGVQRFTGCVSSMTTGATIKTWMVKHTDTELSALFAELAQLGDPAPIPVAIERGEGLVVGLIAAAGHPVLMVEPAAFKATRPRWGAAGAKSDAA